MRPSYEQTRDYLRMCGEFPYRQVMDMALRRQGGLCFYCGEKLYPRSTVLDHLVPRRSGGVDEHTNRVAACSPCDGKKRDRLPTFDEIEKQIALRGEA